jgi:serine/threonine-protein phosphatase 2A activator
VTAEHGLLGQPACKRITSAADLKAVLSSQSMREFLGFVLHLNVAATSKTLTSLASVPASPIITQLVTLLDTLGSWVDEIPPAEQSLRYGNPSFRVWHARLVQHAQDLLQPLLPPHLQSAVAELVPYLTDSFGNPVRIDYGTGHETTFAALLFCLARLGLVQQEDCGQLVGTVFAKYVALMRRIQTTYWCVVAA